MTWRTIFASGPWSCDTAGMGALHKSAASISFVGDELDPDEVTRLLGPKATVSARKGGLWRTTLGAEKHARRGFWSLRAERRAPGDLDGQINDLLDRCSEDLDKWRSCSQRYQGNVFCGLFLASGNEGLTLRPETLGRVAERGLIVDLDIYGLDESAGPPDI